MESNGDPKVDNPQVVSADNKELQLKAVELAKATRERGMGIILGKFPPRLTDKVGLFTFLGSFYTGRERRESKDCILSSSYISA